MHTDENKMNFLRHLLNTLPDLTLREAFTLLDAATMSFPAAGTTPPSTDGVWHNGVFFSLTAEGYMQADKKIQAIKEVRKDNMTPDLSALDVGYFGLKQAKEAVEARMSQMGYPSHRW